MKISINRVVFVSLMVLLAMVVTSCGGSEGAGQSGGGTSAAMTDLSVQLNWFPEPEHGAIYAAQVGNLYKDSGLNVKALPGGPQVSSIQIVASGKADFGIADADTIAQARAEGIPVVAIAASFQTNPQVLIYHEGAGITKPEDISGRTVYVAPTANYWAYIQKKYNIKSAKVLAYTGSLAPFVADKEAVNQGYITSEPYILEKENKTPVKYFLNADLGYNPYVTLYTTEKMIRERPETVKRFVEASVKGWDYYFANTAKINQVIKTQNGKLSDGLMAYSADAEKPLVYGKDNKQGQMSEERWKVLVDQLVEIGALKPGSVDPKSCYTTEFLPQQ